MDEILNFRGLAANVKNKEGKIIKPNTIFRSGMVGKATCSDIDRLLDYNVKNIFDFRSKDEVSKLSTLSHSQINTTVYDILSSASQSQKSFESLSSYELNYYMNLIYRDLFPKASNYKKALEEILALDGEPLLFHCSAGKDRTGVFGIILMSILDFDINDIENEYLSIDRNSIDSLKSHYKELFKIENIEEYSGLFTVKRSYFEYFLEGVIENHSSMDGYLNYLGITQDVKRKFKELYLV